MSLVRHSAPHHGRVGDVPIGIGRPVDGDLSSLRVQVPHEFAGHIDDAQASLVIRLVQLVVFHPDVVCSELRYLVSRDHSRVLRIRKVDDLDVALRAEQRASAPGFRIVALGVVTPGSMRPFVGQPPPAHDLVADEDVKLVGRLRLVREHRVRSAARHRVIGHEHGVLDRTAPPAVPHVHHDDAGSPLRRVRDAVMHPHVVHPAVGVVVLAHILWVVDVAHVEDDILVAAGERKQVVVGRKRVMHSTCQSLIVHRRDLRVGRVGKIQDHHAVAAVGSPLTRHRGIPRVWGHLDVVDRTSVDLNRVRLEDVARVRNVPHERMPVCHLGAGDGIIAPVEPLEHPEVRGAISRRAAQSNHVEALHHVSRHRPERLAVVERPGGSDHRVHAGHIGHELAIVHLTWSARRDDVQRRRVAMGPRDGNVVDDSAIGVPYDRRKGLHVTGAYLVQPALNFELRGRQRNHAIAHCSTQGPE